MITDTYYLPTFFSHDIKKTLLVYQFITHKHSPSDTFELNVPHPDHSDSSFSSRRANCQKYKQAGIFFE